MNHEFPENDADFEEHEIKAVRQSEGGGWEITHDRSLLFFVPKDSPVAPEVGMTVRFYPAAQFTRKRGLFLGGRKVFYRTEDEQHEHAEIQMYGADAADLLRKWDAGETCHTIEMGGMGPGYEQAIHILTFEMIRYMLTNPPDFEAWDKEAEFPDKPYELRYWTQYSKKMDEVLWAGPPCKDGGYSGAQYGAAANLATMFLRHGPRHVMNDERVKDRHIMVSKHFPQAA